jgi:hypothetical protein
VASGANGVKNGTDWTGCQAGSVPGYDCTMSEAECGTIDTYWGASCEEASFCGNVAMQACIGSTPYDCPGGGP